ncbi:alpha-amylase [Streptomyces sp. TLI_171]|uniref:alpha-amylase n=1 Tax=Streptomyces sp. TLI_171 TaxID=1938859 RepID=UPI000C193E72|nr:alpha-amylase [Streptomyces sp. TLI_171]RKE17263.1 alpha amylase inhibitor [Streptomyces sp. TLI_171]
MTNTLRHASRSVALAATALLAALAAAPSASAASAAAGTPAPSCVQYYSSWRYTQVANGCDAAVSVTVQYTDGQSSPCRTLQAGEWGTFAGYGTDMNYVTGLLTCDPAGGA